MFPHFQRFSDWELNAEERRVNKLSCGHQLNRTGMKYSSTHTDMQLLRKPEPNARPAHRKEVVKWLLHLFIVTSRRRLIHPSERWRMNMNEWRKPKHIENYRDHAHALAILSLHFVPWEPPIPTFYYFLFPPPVVPSFDCPTQKWQSHKVNPCRIIIRCALRDAVLPRGHNG